MHLTDHMHLLSQTPRWRVLGAWALPASGPVFGLGLSHDTAIIGVAGGKSGRAPNTIATGLLDPHAWPLPCKHHGLMAAPGAKGVKSATAGCLMSRFLSSRRY